MGKAENLVEGYLVKQAKKRNIFCCKFVSPSMNGVPDRMIIKNGHTIFIETKSATGKLRESQKVVIKIMREHGATVYVANSKEQIDEILASL